MTSETPEQRVWHALAALELAGIQYRRGVRLRLRVGEEELTALLYLAHHGSVSQRRLSDATGLSRSGAGAMIQRLEERGFVRRSTDTTDRRLRQVELSPAGCTELASAYRELHATAGELLRTSTEAELDRLAGILRAIATAADADEPPARSVGGEPAWQRWA